MRMILLWLLAGTITGCAASTPAARPPTATEALPRPAASVPPATRPSASVPEEDIEQIREVAFRQLLAAPDPDEVILIAFGTDASGRWIDPSDAFLQKLADLHLPLHKASEADTKHAPELDELDRFRGVRDAAGRRASIYFVRLLNVISSDEVEVEAARFGGPLNAGGSWWRVKRIRGRWRVDENAGNHLHWVS